MKYPLIDKYWMTKKNDIWYKHCKICIQKDRDYDKNKKRKNIHKDDIEHNNNKKKKLSENKKIIHKENNHQDHVNHVNIKTNQNLNYDKQDVKEMIIVHSNFIKEEKNTSKYKNKQDHEHKEYDHDKQYIRENQIHWFILKDERRKYVKCPTCKKYMIPKYQQYAKFVNGIDMRFSAWCYCCNRDCLHLKNTGKPYIQHYYNPNKNSDQININRVDWLKYYLNKNDPSIKLVEWKLLYTWLYYLTDGKGVYNLKYLNKFNHLYSYWAKRYERNQLNGTVVKIIEN